MEAAVGIAQVEESEQNLSRRRDIAARYDEALAPLRDRLQLPSAPPEMEHVWMFYPLRLVDPKTDRAALVAHLERRGIETRYLLPLINQPVYRTLFKDLDEQAFPVAATLNERAFYVGCHPQMSDHDVERVVTSILSFFSESVA